MIKRLHSWIAGLGLLPRSPTLHDAEAGVLDQVDIILDQVGDDPDVSLRRRWKEDCRSYRLRLQVVCQEEIIRREKFENLLTLLLNTERK